MPSLHVLLWVSLCKCVCSCFILIVLCLVCFVLTLTSLDFVVAVSHSVSHLPNYLVCIQVLSFFLLFGMFLVPSYFVILRKRLLIFTFVFLESCVWVLLCLPHSCPWHIIDESCVDFFQDCMLWSCCDIYRVTTPEECFSRLVFLPFVDNLSYCGWMISQILSGRNSCTTSSSMQFCKSFSMVLWSLSWSHQVVFCEKWSDFINKCWFPGN